MRVQTVLKIVIGVLVVAILIVSGALLRFVFAGGRPEAPRTELERAVFESEQAVKANPNDANARVKLAAAYLEQGSNSQALTQARAAARLNPKDPSPYYVLGMAESANGQYGSAVTSLKKAVTTTGQVAQFYQDVYVEMARAQEKLGKVNEALASLGKAIDYGPENSLLLVERAQMFERAKKYYDASIDYVWALYYNPDQPDAKAALARLQTDHAKDVKKAADYVKSLNAGDAAPGYHPPSIDSTGTSSSK